MKYIILILVMMFTISCHQKNNINSHQIQIEFDGFKRMFYKKYNLYMNIKGEDAVDNMKKMMEMSQVKYICNYRPVMWEADVYEGTKKEGNKLFTVGSNTEGQISVLKKGICYENELLIEVICKLVHIDEIEKFDGKMTQDDFDIIIQQEMK